MLTILGAVLAITLVIFVHEMGHFVTAKRLGVIVEEFGFGFPPRLLRLWRDRATVYVRGEKMLIDKGVEIPEDAVIGYDQDHDAARGFTVSEGGITVIAKAEGIGKGRVQHLFSAEGDVDEEQITIALLKVLGPERYYRTEGVKPSQSSPVTR